jgi:diguanylate cyclase (GGDEF)-like protein
MLARGEVYGLLQIFSDDPNGADLDALRPLAMALADSMSLALSSLALRERLRNQALRDPLTGLYNRRFMEEVLESFALQAERRNAPMSAVMIDLDHFKQLNDQHGHAVGDTVLRDVAGVILASLRKSDVACRYGGEELIILLPDSDLVAARTKAEEIRKRIADLLRCRRDHGQCLAGRGVDPANSNKPQRSSSHGRRGSLQGQAGGSEPGRSRTHAYGPCQAIASPPATAAL